MWLLRENKTKVRCFHIIADFYLENTLVQDPAYIWPDKVMTNFNIFQTVNVCLSSNTPSLGSGSYREVVLFTRYSPKRVCLAPGKFGKIKLSILS